MNRLEASFVFLLLFFALAVGFGLLTWISRNVWQSKPKTQLFALLGVVSTTAFVILVMVVLP